MRASLPSHDLPDANRLSVLAATILLAYALTRVVSIPPREFTTGFLGILLHFEVNFKTVVSILVAALASTGMEWLVKDHPALTTRGGKRQSTFPHWILPALTAWVIGVPLNYFPAQNPAWWAVFGMGGLLLVLVIIAEYNVVDISDYRHPVATVGLTALSFTLYLILAIALRSAGLRLYEILPALIPAAGLVALRTLYLRLGGRWLFAWSVGIAVVVGQIALGLHYWPLTPIRFGLILLGPTYSLTSLAGGLVEGRGIPGLLFEPAIMLALIWGLAVWLA